MELDKVVEFARKSVINLNSDSYLPNSNRIALFIDKGIDIDNSDNTLGIHEFAKSLVNDKVDTLCFSNPTDYQSLVKKKLSTGYAFEEIDGVKYINNLLPDEFTKADSTVIYNEKIKQYVHFLKVYRPVLAMVNASIEVIVFALSLIHI